MASSNSKLSNNLLLTLSVGIAFVLMVACDGPRPQVQETTATPVSENIDQLDYSVIATYPHDLSSFTEGFLVHQGQLYESTGAPDNLPQTRSLFGSVDLKTGKISKKAELDKSIYFGEGICFLKDNLYQLTYKNQTAFIYDANNFKAKGQFNYANVEGWGLTTDGKSLIMSDGTSNLTFLDEKTHQATKTLTVTEYGSPLQRLNELEWIKGFIYANVWLTNTIVKIDPGTGKVVAKLDLSSIVYDARTKNQEVDVLNGIAYDEQADKIYITGKLYTNIYQISFNH